MTAAIVWFRQDLRLADNPALRAACDRGGVVIPVFIWAPDEEGDWPPGGAGRYWLHQSLASLSAELERLGSRLIIRRGDSLAELGKLIKSSAAEAVFWNRRYEPAVVERDAGIKAQLRDQGVTVESFNGNLLLEPSQTFNKQGRPFRVFTPFWRHCRKLGEPVAPLPAVRKLRAPDKWPRSLKLDALELEPRIDWAGGIRAHWTFGSKGARESLREFLADDFQGYPKQRDYPGVHGVSRLSPRLHFGELSPRQVWHAVREHEIERGYVSETRHAEAYLRQLGWREFGHHLLYHFPHTAQAPLNDAYRDFPWRWNTAGLRAWQRGETGYPLVDAGMRELWHSGYLHNRVRMVVASFLVKHLLVHWLAGARWFWDTLVDADLANNTLGWQWAAGCGADAAPYFRIFNPVRQAERFDPNGDYVRYWVPELNALSNKALLAPWQADADELKSAGVVLGKTYPQPIVDHKQARQAALAALDTIKKKT
ncbi:deoxyribodipyrimidine photo-lyase [Methylohalomonas lacus]|uniref:Deoxyribodipyrimidine photo-lyase n=1 Tax=Methylohalomonas lacus TaxID=398773 RepID=A0AAE3HKZ0_9GAMM|nr:deoxyribodipyrimidine photo-lyase [Methylohalomonas lacus]MCS3902342.1 deoxyribodipyrimidine photo-lyase [Methylohalomonas lacus]